MQDARRMQELIRRDHEMLGAPCQDLQGQSDAGQRDETRSNLRDDGRRIG
jgi:hypothetical protein